MGYIRVIYGTYMGYIKPKDERKANIGDKEGKLEAIGTWATEVGSGFYGLKL